MNFKKTMLFLAAMASLAVASNDDDVKMLELEGDLQQELGPIEIFENDLPASVETTGYDERDEENPDSLKDNDDDVDDGEVDEGGRNLRRRCRANRRWYCRPCTLVRYRRRVVRGRWCYMCQTGGGCTRRCTGWKRKAC